MGLDPADVCHRPVSDLADNDGSAARDAAVGDLDAEELYQALSYDRSLPLLSAEQQVCPASPFGAIPENVSTPLSPAPGRYPTFSVRRGFHRPRAMPAPLHTRRRSSGGRAPQATGWQTVHPRNVSCKTISTALRIVLKAECLAVPGRSVVRS